MIRNQETPVIQYLNVASDLSSTKKLIRELTKHKSNSKYIVLTSSIERANTICDEVDNPNSWIIHSESATFVVSCLLETIEEVNENGNGMIITTVEDFSELPFFEDQESWLLITDQALEKFDHFNRSSFCNQAVLTDYLEVKQETHWNEYQLKLIEKDLIVKAR